MTRDDSDQVDLIYKYPDTPEAPEPTYWHRDIANSSEDLGIRSNTRIEIKVAYRLSDCLTPGCGNTWLAPNDYVVQSADFLERVRDPIARQFLGALRKPNSQIDDAPLRESAR